MKKLLRWLLWEIGSFFDELGDRLQEPPDFDDTEKHGYEMSVYVIATDKQASDIADEIMAMACLHKMDGRHGRCVIPSALGMKVVDENPYYEGDNGE